MPSEKAHTVLKAQRCWIYAVILSLILVLPIADAATVPPVSVQVTTKPARLENLTVTILKPLPNVTYIHDRFVNKSFLKDNRTFVYGPITILANVTGAMNLSKVDFLVDGVSIGIINVTSNSTQPFNLTWAPRGSLLKHTITVTAFDETGNASASVNISKWRFHPLPLLIVAGILGVTMFIPRTTIRGFVFNMHKNLFGYTFFALRVHYKSVSLVRRDSGTIFMKRVRVGPAISMHMFNFSPLKLAHISSTFLGTFSP